MKRKKKKIHLPYLQCVLPIFIAIGFYAIEPISQKILSYNDLQILLNIVFI